MALYIDVEKIILIANTMVDDSGEVYVALSDVRKAIALAPTADVAPRAEVARWIFENSPFEMLDIAFKRLFPDNKYTAYFEPNIRDSEHGEKVCGLTDFGDDGEITVFVDTELSINDAVEIFAHELAHVAVGVEHDHDEVWEKAFDDLFNEYNRIGEEMFGSNVDAPKGESYSNALSEIDKIKCNFAREIFEKIEEIINSDEIDKDLLYDEYYGASVALARLDAELAELKKEYTEGQK